MSTPIDPNIQLAVTNEIRRLEDKLNERIDVLGKESQRATDRARNMVAAWAAALGLIISIFGYFKVGDYVESTAKRKVDELGGTNILNTARENANAVLQIRTNAANSLSTVRGLEAEARMSVTNLGELSRYRVVLGRIAFSKSSGTGKGYRFKRQGSLIEVTFDPPLDRVPAIFVSNGDAGGKDFDNVSNYKHLSNEKVVFATWDMGSADNKSETKLDAELTFAAIY